MGYIEERVLEDNDKIVYRAYKNPIYVFLSWVWGILGCWLLLIPTIMAIIRTLRYCTTECVVTTNRVIEKYGLVATCADEMRFEKVENITVKYTFFGKIFNYDRICFQGANMNNIDFPYIKDAERVKKEVSIIVYG